MDKDKNSLYTFLAVITMIITQILFKSIGMENISVQIFVSLLIIVSLIIVIGTIKNKNKGLGVKYNVTICILATLSNFIMGLTFIFQRCYPNIHDKHELMFLILDLVSFFALIFYIIIYRIIYEVKSNKTH